MENIIRNAFKSLDEFTDVKIQSIKLTEDVEEIEEVEFTETDDMSVVDFLDKQRAFLTTYDFDVNGRTYSLFIEALTENGESCDTVYDEFDKEKIEGLLVEILDDEHDFIESLGDIADGADLPITEAHLSDLVREAKVVISGSEEHPTEDEEIIDIEEPTEEESGHSLKKDSELGESKKPETLCESLEDSIAATFKREGVDEGDISDEIYDWGVYVCYTEEPVDNYDKFMNYLLENIEMVEFKSDWYSPCKVTEFMLEHFDAFAKFFNEENGEAFRPDSYEGVNWSEDEEFYDVFLASLESLINGNYTDEDYGKILSYLENGDVEKLDTIELGVEEIEEDVTEQPKKKETKASVERKEKKQLKYLLDKESCCPLDRDEMFELQDLIMKYGYPEGYNEELRGCKEDVESDVELCADGECGHCKKKNLKETVAEHKDYTVIVSDIVKALPRESAKDIDAIIWQVNSKAAKGEITPEEAEYIAANITDILAKSLKEKLNRRKLKEEKEFSINNMADMHEAEEILNSEEEEGVEQIVDINAETIDDLEKTYVGSAILQCDTCKTMIYKDPADLNKPEGQDLYNLDEECPHCGSKEGYILVGQVATLDTDPNAVSEPPMDVEPEVDEVSIEETEIEPVEASNDEIEPIEVEPVEGGEEVEISSEETDEPVEETEEEDDFPVLNLESLNEDASKCYGVYQEVDNYYYKHHPDLVIGFIKKGLTKEEAEQQVKELEGREGCHYSVKKVKDCTEEETNEDLIESVNFKKFDSLAKRYIKEVYSNVNTYNSTKATKVDGDLVVEGIIKFNNGKEFKTSFVFESCNITKRGKARLVGYNETFSTAKKAFTLVGNLDGSELLSESMTYNYTIKQLNESKKVYGRVVTPKRLG